MSDEHSAENDAGCTLCGRPLEAWPCDATWDGEHRPLRPIPPEVHH